MPSTERSGRRAAARYAKLAHTLGDLLSAPVHHAAWRETICADKFVHDDDLSSAGEYAQAVACGLMTLQSCRGRLSRPAAQSWLIDAANPLCRNVLRDCFAAQRCLETGRPPASIVCRLIAELYPECIAASDGAFPAAAECYQQLLREIDPRKRASCGVYVTPDRLARFIVRAIHESLKNEFGLRLGLADTATRADVLASSGTPEDSNGRSSATPFVRILDPATGSGVFLMEVVRTVHEAFIEGRTTDGADKSRVEEDWNTYVCQHLLPRMTGVELMLAPCVAAHINLAARLAETGFRFDAPGKLRLPLADALAGQGSHWGPSEVAHEQNDDAAAPFTVILGNPPFLASALPGHDWIQRLLKGHAPDGGRVASYYEVDGQPLGEKKMWLHDDYVKFVRSAHWQIERAGCGVVGLVTNHGYLDNVTFRGMRQQLSLAFPRITVIDLHGNRKKREMPPDGVANENVFAIDQGVAVGLFRRPPATTTTSTVQYAELWGTREEKLARLDGALPTDLDPQPLDLAAPQYLFVPRDAALREEYERGWRLPEVMPLGTTAPVTARDGFVVALSRGELVARLEAFRDLRISDDSIRDRYFGNGRSVRFPRGDTRGWKLSEARRRVAADSDWQERITQCQYRPLDRRVIYWAQWMVDWPRESVMRHMHAGDNVALIARRQMPPGGSCNYFWATADIALDGVIRNDNRGSESLFPLFVYERESANESTRRANIAPEFIETVAALLDLEWASAADTPCPGASRFGPFDVVGYVYALFHSTAYPQRFAAQLGDDFPRVFLPSGRELFRRLAALGGDLLRWHTDQAAPPEAPARFASRGDRLVARDAPTYDDGRVQINDRAEFYGVSADVWQFQVGAHQVCHKWLKDRRGRQLTPAEIDQYCRIVAVLGRTLQTMRQIDREIGQAGGWPRAFSA